MEHAGQRALTGLRSRELAPGNSSGGRSNHLFLDDTNEQIQAQLKSDHQHSQLSLGVITRKLIVDICGKDGFAAIARDIAAAKESIDLVCWGFDPGMELDRNGYNWPGEDTFGDLLIAAGRRGREAFGR